MNPARNSEFRILCVEDEPAIRRDIADELRECGFVVDEAADGEAALELVERTQPDLIISDIQMPRMDGHALLEALRGRKDAKADIPFIFLTAFGDRDSMLAGRRKGADDYLVKPIDFDLLIAATESHLINARRRAERAALGPGPLKMAIRIGGRAEFLAELEQREYGTPFAIVAVDNLLELVSRLGDQQSDHYSAFFQKLEQLRGLRVFQMAPYKFGVIGRREFRLDAALARLVSFPIRDRTQRGQGQATLNCSIVTEVTRPGMVIADLVDEMRAAARMLQREGGAQLVTLDGPELATLQQAGAIRGELVDAIGQGQLTIRLQPKVDIATEKLLGAEVLVRWQSPRLGTLSPVTFIPILERAGLLHHVTDWVMRQAAECQIELKRRGMPARLAVNIGANEFRADLPQRLCHIFADVGADPALFELEITETTLMEDLVTSAMVIEELRAKGIRIALDDFGTGYSSLSYLSGCPVDALKIDRSFVNTIGEGATHQKVVEGIIELGAKLGVELVAEGVETKEQRAWLQARGNITGQGYLFAAPMAVDDYYAFAARSHGRPAGLDGLDFVI